MVRTKVLRQSRSVPDLSVRIPSLSELDATVASWPAPERRGSCDSDAGSIFSDLPCLSPSAVSRSAPPTPLDCHFTLSTRERNPVEAHEAAQIQDLGIHLEYTLSPRYPGRHDYQPRSIGFNDLSRHRLSRPRTPDRDTRRGPLSPVRSAVEKQSSRTKIPHCNKKYHWVDLDFITYAREDLARSWDEVTEMFRRNAARLAQIRGEAEDTIERTASGLQAVFYRENLVIPAIDDDGSLLFNERGEEYTMELKVREQRAKHLGLIDRHAERVVFMNYWFVRPEDMERAKELGMSHHSLEQAIRRPKRGDLRLTVFVLRPAARREKQRADRGVPKWDLETSLARLKGEYPSSVPTNQEPPSSDRPAVRSRL